jgi:UDP-2-acetamido-2,6-beta-L-arabino-hexul-4-ose reductase
MKILVTGSNGFIGKNLVEFLERHDVDVLCFDIGTFEPLESLVSKSDTIVNLAGVNRPLTSSEFYDGNVNFVVRLVDAIKKTKRKIPVILSSSIQATQNNDYGKSKKMAEDYLLDFQSKTGNPIYIYRFQNVFGKWCRPSYNSVVATFCYNIANGLPISVNNPNAEIDFVYIDDIVKTIFSLINSGNLVGSASILSVNPSYRETIGHLASLITSFKTSRVNLVVPSQDGGFSSKLYATYLSYLNPQDFSYSLLSHNDNRGSFTEFLRTSNAGQVSINVIKPGVTKGNHYHNTKNEKYLVASGKCSIKFRKIGTENIIEYIVDSNELKVVDIPTGYTHSITNIGKTDSVVIMWASEPFDPKNPDTYAEEVIYGK